MRNTQDKAPLQCCALNFVLLAGSYSVCGQIQAASTASAADFALNWLAAAAAVGMIWLAAAYIEPPLRNDSSGTRLFKLLAVIYLGFTAGCYLRGLIMLWRQWAYHETSPLVLAISAALLTLFGGSRGLRPALRLCLPVSAAVLVFFIADTALLAPEMSLSRLRLVYGAFSPQLFLKLLGALLLPLPAAILLRPADASDLHIPFQTGAVIGLSYLLLSALRSVLLLGSLTVWEAFPLLRTLTLVYVGPGLSRMDAWGLMALTGAMMTAAISMSAASLQLLSAYEKKKMISALLMAVLTFMAIF